MSIRFPQVGAFVPFFGLAVSAQASITGYVLLPDYSGASCATATLKSTGALSISAASRVPVYVNVFDLKGKRGRSAPNAELAQGAYEAMTPWAIVNTSRAWTVYVSVTASGVVTSASSSNVYDGTVSMSIPGQASGGYLNYYIRWQSAMTLMQTYRDKMKAMPAHRINAWRDYSRRTTRISTGGHGLRLSGAGGDWNIVPKMVMWGSSAMITETDASSLRKTWHEIKGNFGY